MKQSKSERKIKSPFLARLALRAVKKNKLVLFAWLVLFILGILSYTTFLKREGFPPVNFPGVIISGTYFIDDAQKTDEEVVQPLLEALEPVEKITDYQSESRKNYYSIFLSLEDDVLLEAKIAEVKEIIKEVDLPKQVNPQIEALDISKFINYEYHLLLTTYGQDDEDQNYLFEKSDLIAQKLTQLPEVQSALAINVFEEVFNQKTQTEQTEQTKITKIGLPEENRIAFYPAVNIGIVKVEGADDLKLSQSIKEIIAELSQDETFNGTQTIITADIAESINDQLGSLGRNLISGLIAVIIISLLLINWRTALITALFIPVVILITMLGFYLAGISLNTITLFTLILTLGLFVDDATIVVEAIDANRRNHKKRSAVIMQALGKVGFASLVGTVTTILVFSPMLFASGVLGKFIRLLPITVILSLSISFIVSLLLMPILARYLVLPKRRNILDKIRLLNPIEEAFSSFLSKLPLINQKRPAKGFFISVLMIGISIVAFGGAMHYARNLPFDIFPSPKDGDNVIVNIEFSPGTTIEQAQSITDTIDEGIKQAVGDELRRVVYYQADQRLATIDILLTPYQERNITYRQILEKLKPVSTQITEANVEFSLQNNGPPTLNFPFQARIYNSNEEIMQKVTKEIETFIQPLDFKVSNQDLKVSETSILGLDQQTIYRSQQGRYYTVAARFDKKELTSGGLIFLTGKVKEHFNEEKLANYGLEKDDLVFAGPDNENQESFTSIVIGSMIAMIAMYLLLIVLFKSFLQPFLILLAVPFSLFGVFFGLTLTNNSISFFVMLGLLGLIGIAVNNTILLVESANQYKRQGINKYEAISGAIKDRFRPLVVTTLTTVAALLPLALSTPFWEALAYTIIFGMLSSGFLIIISFPYYYLLLERIYDFKKKKRVKHPVKIKKIRNKI